jgi:hypothetical protein
MTQQEKRIKIAEACGWKLVTNDPDYQPYWLSPNGNRVGTDCGVRIPNYFHDLNVMHDAEGILTLSEEQLYFETLHGTAGNTMFYRATASQRAEAFGKTLNLW